MMVVRSEPIEMRKVTKVWKQKDGTKIRICDMTDSHLENATNLLQKYAFHVMTQTHLALFSYDPSGDGAIDAHESACASASEETFEDYVPVIFWSLQYEQDRRTILERKQHEKTTGR